MECEGGEVAMTRPSGRSWHAVVVMAVLVLTGCQDAPREPHPLEATGSASPTSGAVPTGSTEPSGTWTIEDSDVTESSGLARGTRHPDVLYTHNDRGSEAELFAIDRNGTRAVLQLDVTAVDWEDIASSPDGRLWIADTGDNEEQRESVALHVVEEPEVLASGSVPTTTYDLRFPDGPHDAEGLLVDPRDMRVYLVTKSADGGRVYAAPVRLDAGAVNDLTPVGEAPRNVTGAAFAPDGSMLVMRNQGRAFFYDELGAEPTVVPLPSQPQGESVTFTSDGTHVLVGSEGPASTVLEVPVPGLRP